VTLTNSGDLAANGVKVDDTLPGFIGTPTDISNSGIFSAGHIVWNNLTVLGHDSLVLTYKATVNSSLPNGTTVLHNEAKLGCSPRETIASLVIATSFIPACPYTGTATDETSVTLTPTIRIDKQGPTQVNAGDNITYTLHWFIGGTGSVANAVVTDVLPANTTFVSADLGGTNASGTVTWNLGAKNAGDSGVVTLVVQSNAQATNGTLVTNTGNFVATDLDQVNDSVNTTLVATTVLQPQVLGATTTPGLSITKTVNKSTAKPGDVVKFTITVKSTGDGDAENVTVTDTLPDGLTFVGSTGKTKTWLVGSIAPGQSHVINVEVRVSDKATKGDLVNVATAVANEVSQVQSSAILTVVKPQVLGLATTGSTSVDYAIFILGAFLVAFGALGLNLRRTARLPK
jgi:uncharacterized repeat protein (TIGR01451 family)